eukprot:Sspe_Gene.55615::Locus_30581_Transcript_1_1_Confidence_1.000_Length_622::g.55615::m.55615
MLRISHTAVRGLTNLAVRWQSSEATSWSVMGSLEDVDTSLPSGKTKDGKTFWRHRYTVNGTSAVRHVFTEGKGSSPLPDMVVGAKVNMTVAQVASGTLILRNIRPATPVEVETIVDEERAQVQLARRQRITRKTREAIILAVLSSPASGNLDLPSYQKVVEALDHFVETGTMPTIPSDTAAT